MDTRLQNRIQLRKKLLKDIRCVKSVHIRSSSGPYFLTFRLNTLYLIVFSLNAGKYGPEKLRMQTLFTQ